MCVTVAHSLTKREKEKMVTITDVQEAGLMGTVLAFAHLASFFSAFFALGERYRATYQQLSSEAIRQQQKGESLGIQLKFVKIPSHGAVYICIAFVVYVFVYLAVFGTWKRAIIDNILFIGDRDVDTFISAMVIHFILLVLAVVWVLVVFRFGQLAIGFGLMLLLWGMALTVGGLLVSLDGWWGAVYLFVGGLASTGAVFSSALAWIAAGEPSISIGVTQFVGVHGDESTG